MSEKREGRRQTTPAAGAAMVVDLDHRHPPGQDRGARLSDPGADRHAQLPRHDLADAARRGADAGAVAPARGGAGRGRRPRPARAVDRDLAHGGDLRPAAERRDGVGDQRARRRARRRRPAVHGAVCRRSTPARRPRRPRQRWSGTRPLHRRARQDHPGLRPSLARRRSARGAAAGAGSRGAARRPSSAASRASAGIERLLERARAAASR